MKFRAAAALMTGVLLTSSCADEGRLAKPEGSQTQSSLAAQDPSGDARSSGAPGAAAMLTELVSSDENFGQLALEADDSLVLWWHGEIPSDALESVALKYPDVAVRVSPVDAVPGDLREIARSLVETNADLGVGAAYVEADFSKIVVQVDDQVQDYNALAAALTNEAGFPVEVSGGAPVRAN